MGHFPVVIALTGLLLLGGCDALESETSCLSVLMQGDIQRVAKTRERRFLGKITGKRAHCLGGDHAVVLSQNPWMDWPNFWGTGDSLSLSSSPLAGSFFGPNERGINSALYELELQRIELIKFNLFDNSGTYQAYITGREGKAGPVLQTWPEMQLPPTHPHYQDVEHGQEHQVCGGELIRFRTVTGICNDIYNPLMGPTHQVFACNVQFNTTFPDLGFDEIARNRHGDRLGLLKPDPQVISRKLFTRTQSQPDKCRNGHELSGDPEESACDYKKAPVLNVLAAFWIQFMTHDWFFHVDEEPSQTEWMAVGCTTQRFNNSEQPLTEDEIKQLGCRPGDRINVAPIDDDTLPASFIHDGQSYLTRAPKTTRNHVTAWWDASQLYGYDERSSQRVKRDPGDAAKLALIHVRESVDGGVMSSDICRPLRRIIRSTRNGQVRKQPLFRITGLLD